MNARDAVFWLLAAVALVAGWRVFRVASMVRATFALLLSFAAVGAIMLLLGAPYLGSATVFMMAAEMAVMAVFMVMFMMNPAGLNPMSMVHQPKLAAFMGGAVFVGLSVASLLTDFPVRPAGTQRVVEALGRELLGDSMLVFETAGVTLLATMVGAVVLSSRAGRHGWADEGSEPPGLDEGGRPAGQQPEPAAGGMHGMHGMGEGMHDGKEHGMQHAAHEMHGNKDPDGGST